MRAISTSGRSSPVSPLVRSRDAALAQEVHLLERIDDTADSNERPESIRIRAHLRDPGVRLEVLADKRVIPDERGSGLEHLFVQRAAEFYHRTGMGG